MTSPCPERRSTLYIEPRVELLSAVCPLPIAKPSGGDPVKVSTMVGTGFSPATADWSGAARKKPRLRGVS